MRLLRDIQAQRQSDLQTLTESCAYAAQAVVATVLVILLYRWLGAGIGVAVSLAVPQRIVAVAISLTLIVIACELLRLDAGVRSACASVLIVTMAPGSLVERGEERAVAVCIGCGVALALQVVLYGITGRFLKTSPVEDQFIRTGDE